MPVEILGNVYEQFLGKVIRLTPAHQAKVEEKPEVEGRRRLLHARLYRRLHRQADGGQRRSRARKAPNAVHCRGLPRSGHGLRFGFVLLGAYQYLLDYYLQWYIDHADLPGSKTS